MINVTLSELAGYPDGDIIAEYFPGVSNLVAFGSTQGHLLIDREYTFENTHDRNDIHYIALDIKIPESDLLPESTISIFYEGPGFYAYEVSIGGWWGSSDGTSPTAKDCYERALRVLEGRAKY
jgi:hypothetical protein